MTLDELLHELRDGMLRDTSDRVSGDSDQLWSDTKLIGYIDQAQRRFARRSLCIRDATSAASQFLTVAYQQDYTLDPSILAVTSMRSMGNGVRAPTQVRTVNGISTASVFTPNVAGAAVVYPDRLDLARTSHTQRRGQGYYDVRDADCAWDVNNLGSYGYLGKPLSFETDESTVETGGSAGTISVRLYPVPDMLNAGCLVQMRVCRMPLQRLVPDNLDAVPEIPEQHHMDMLDYAAYLALRIVDHEAGDPTRAQEFQQSFNAHVEEARTEMDRKRFQPLSWGFGANGFSYTQN